jgi:YggT family protein
VTAPVQTSAFPSAPPSAGAHAAAFLPAILPLVHLGLGLVLAVWTLLFLFRIVLSWYPQVDLEKGAMRLVRGPTEPLLAPTRRLIQPIGGVDVTPVVWVGLISLIRELLVGQQGLLTQLLLRGGSVA